MRKPVHAQMIRDHKSLYVICDDGTVWHGSLGKRPGSGIEWTFLEPPLPGSKADLEGSGGRGRQEP